MRYFLINFLIAIVVLLISINFSFLFSQIDFKKIDSSLIFVNKLIPDSNNIFLDASSSADLEDSSIIHEWEFEGKKTRGVKCIFKTLNNGNLDCKLKVFDQTEVFLDTTFMVFVEAKKRFDILYQNKQANSRIFVYFKYKFKFNQVVLENQKILWLIDDIQYEGQEIDYIFSERKKTEVYMVLLENDKIVYALKTQLDVKFISDP